jgi:serine/threonine protein kinase
MDMPTDPNLGHMIRGYRLEQILKKEKLTTLYHARTKEIWLPTEISIMLLHIPPTLPEYARKQFKERFTTEARRLIKLRHPSLHPLFGYGEEKGQFYLLYPPYTAGTTLATQLQQQKQWTPTEVFSILAPLCNVFDYIHSQKVAYQFFSAANVLLQEDGVPQLQGTGLAQLLLMRGLSEERSRHEDNQHLKTIVGEYISSPNYLAPEVVRGEPATARSDIYSLGILLFVLLSGKLPYTGTTYMEVAQKHIREPLPMLHTLAPNIPIALELVVNRALHREPERRFATAEELTTTLAHTLDKRRAAAAYFPFNQTNAQKQTGPIQALASDQAHEEFPPHRAETTHSQKDAVAEVADIPSVPDEESTESQSNTNMPLLPDLKTYSDMDKMAQHIQEIRQRIQGDRK